GGRDGSRGCPRRRAPAVELPRARGPRVVSRAGRVAGLGVLVFLLGLVGAGAALLARFARDDEPPATTTVAAPPKPLRIGFPEGFTRREMAARVTAVNEIAQRKRHVRPRLSQ